MPFMWLGVGLVKALAVHKGLKGLLIASLVDIGATPNTSQVSSGFF